VRAPAADRHRDAADARLDETARGEELLDAAIALADVRRLAGQVEGVADAAGRDHVERAGGERIEAGVGCVTLAIGGWDTHGQNFQQLKRQLPAVDRGVANLIQDLHERGLGNDVVTVMWGEFGRKPKINLNAGRDHWSPVMSALVAGGGLKMGQAVGASTARGERPKDRPYSASQVLSTIYRAVGIDPAQTFVNGAGRPMYILDDRQPVAELL